MRPSGEERRRGVVGQDDGDDPAREMGRREQQTGARGHEAAHDEPVDHPLQHRAMAEIVHRRHRDQAGRHQPAGQTEDGEGPERPVEQRGLHDDPQEAEPVPHDVQLRAAGALVIRHVDLDDLQPPGEDRAGAHGGREVHPVGKRQELREARAPHDAHSARGIAHALRRDHGEHHREEQVAEAPHERHPALRIQPAAEDDVGPCGDQLAAQRREHHRVAGAVGVEDPSRSASVTLQAALIAAP